MKRRARGSDSPPHLERRWSEEGCPRRRVEVGNSDYGGGAARPGRGRAVVEGVAVAESCAGEALFIGGVRWEEGGRGGAPDRELCSSLMAAGPAVALEATLGGGA